MPAPADPMYEVVLLACEEREGNGLVLALLLRVLGYVEKAQLGERHQESC